MKYVPRPMWKLVLLHAAAFSSVDAELVCASVTLTLIVETEELSTLAFVDVLAVETGSRITPSWTVPYVTWFASVELRIVLLVLALALLDLSTLELDAKLALLLAVLTWSLTLSAQLVSARLELDGVDQAALCATCRAACAIILKELLITLTDSATSVLVTINGREPTVKPVTWFVLEELIKIVLTVYVLDTRVVPDVLLATSPETDFVKMDLLPSLTVLDVNAVEDTLEPSVRPVDQITVKTVEVSFLEHATANVPVTILDLPAVPAPFHLDSLQTLASMDLLTLSVLPVSAVQTGVAPSVMFALITQLFVAITVI